MFLTESCYHFHNWELTINILIGTLFRPTWLIFRIPVTGVQTFTVICLNEPVYVQYSILVITWYVLAKIECALKTLSAVCILRTIIYLHIEGPCCKWGVKGKSYMGLVFRLQKLLGTWLFLILFYSLLYV